jgi:hypothetical protein
MEKLIFKFESRPSSEKWSEFLENQLGEILFSYENKELIYEKGSRISRKDYENLIIILENQNEREKENFIEKHKSLKPFIKQIEWQQELSRRILSSCNINKQYLENFFDVITEKRGANESLITGIIGINGIVSLLKNQGYEIRFADPIEDAAMKIDLYARLPSNPRTYWTIQVKTESFFQNLAFKKIGDFLGKTSENIKLIRDLKILNDYTNVLNERYKENFIPVFFGMPSPKGRGFSEKFDRITGFPKEETINKYRQPMLPFSERELERKEEAA